VKDYTYLGKILTIKMN